MMRKDYVPQRGQKIAKKLEEIERVIKGDEAKPTDPFDEIAPPTPTPPHPSPPPKKEQGGA